LVLVLVFVLACPVLVNITGALTLSIGWQGGHPAWQSLASPISEDSCLENLRDTRSNLD